MERRRFLASLAVMSASGCLRLTQRDGQTTTGVPQAQTKTRTQSQSRTNTTSQTTTRPPETANPQEKGKTKWRTEDVSPTTGPVASGDRLFVGAQDKHLYALSTEYGHTLWRTKVGAKIRRPVVADGTVYAFAQQPYDRVEVVALDPKTGARRWVSSELTGTADHRRPLVANGSVYVQSAGRVAVLDAATGKLTAKTKLLPDGPDIDTDRAAMALQDDAVYVAGQLMDSNSEERLVELDPKTGAVRDVRRLEMPDGVDSGYPPRYLTIAGDTAIVLQITPNVEGACICGFDLASGSHKWSVETSGFSNRYVADSGTVFASLLDSPTRLAAIEADSGATRWTKNLGSCCVWPALGPNHVYVPNRAGGRPTIDAVNRKRGTVRWSVETEYKSMLPVAVTEATAYYSNPNHGVYGVWTSD